MADFTFRPINADIAENLRNDSRAVRYRVDEKPGYPCRICLRDAAVGEEVVLVSYDPFDADSPYRSASPVFVHAIDCSANRDISEEPEVMRIRDLSVRAFDATSMMIDASVIAGDTVADEVRRSFADQRTAFVDVHNVVRGCWAGRATRV